VFGADQQRVAVGADVKLSNADNSKQVTGKVSYISPNLQVNQARTLRVEVTSDENTFILGQFVTGLVDVAQYSVPMAVKRNGLQSFRDFTVVYAKVGDEYEVRMLELGREAGKWVEVLGGIKPGTEYVTENSFIIKADIEKSGASHDH
jgi:cobalt-zinc-cadmium efflux system membrane fusion protein